MHGGVSSLHGAARHVAIVTTAAIPWMTGTAVNPCLRAAYMAHCTSHQVKTILQHLLACCAVIYGSHSSHKGRIAMSVQLAFVKSCLSFPAQQFRSFANNPIQTSHSHSIMIHCPACAVCFVQVTLLIPWLNQEDQALVFHGKHSFEQPEEQTECIKDWVRKRTGFEAQFKIQYYPGRYDTSLLGIFPIGDLTVYIPIEEVRLRMLGQAHSTTHAQIPLLTVGAHRCPDAGSL